MKIALIAPTEIPARRANTLQVMKMAQAMVILGHDVRLAVPGRTSGRSTRNTGEPVAWEQLAHHYGLSRTFPVEWLSSHPRLRRYDFSWKALRWASAWQADLIYTRLPQAAALASQLNRATVLEVHDIPQGVSGPWLFQRFMKGNGARRLVVITKALASDISRRFDCHLSAPFTLIAPDGVDLERYERLPEPSKARQALKAQAQALPSSPLQQLSVERFTIGYTGHLYTGRGRELLLDLAKRLPQAAFLVVGGEASDIDAFRNEIQAQRVDNLILTGFVPNAELPLYQAACDVLIMPYQQRVAASSGGDISRYLSPMKLFEYLASRRPIISSDLPVLQEVLNPQNAILVPAHDLDAWVRAIDSLQINPSLRDRLAGQACQDFPAIYLGNRAAAHSGRLMIMGVENTKINQKNTIQKLVWLAGFILASVILAFGLAWTSSGFTILLGWSSFFGVLLVSAGVLTVGWLLVRGEKPPRWLAYILVGAALLRLVMGALWFATLPVYGHGTPAEKAGYVMGDAARRDMVAWKLGRSNESLGAAFENNRSVDQYGGLLFLSAVIYRIFGSLYHQPLLMAVLAAACSALAVIFGWGFARRVWGEKAATITAWSLFLYPEAVLLGGSQMREAFTIPLVAAAFYGLARYRDDRSKSGLAWMLGALLIRLFSPL